MIGSWVNEFSHFYMSIIIHTYAIHTYISTKKEQKHLYLYLHKDGLLKYLVFV